MIDVTRKFLTLTGGIIYFDVITDFAIQRGLEIKDIREISKLQPGTVTVMIKENDFPHMSIPYLKEVNSIGVYLLNSALIFHNPTIIPLHLDTENYFVRFESQIVDIVFEHSHKKPPFSRLKPLIDLIYDE